MPGYDGVFLNNFITAPTPGTAASDDVDDFDRRVRLEGAYAGTVFVDAVATTRMLSPSRCAVYSEAVL